MKPCPARCPGEARDLCYGQHLCSLPAGHPEPHDWVDRRTLPLELPDAPASGVD